MLYQTMQAFALSSKSYYNGHRFMKGAYNFMFNKIVEKEYIITNGLGGFSSGSITGANTRKYHAILNASLNPPVNRTVLVSRLMTEIIKKEEVITLESTELQDQIIDNTSYLKDFSDLPIPTFNYQHEGTEIKKEISMAYGHNTTAVRYEVQTQEEITIRVRPFINSRDHHDLSEKNSFSYDMTQEAILLSFKNDLANFKIKGFGEFVHEGKWSDTELYRIETRRGQEDLDCNFSPGYFEVTIPAHTKQSFSVISSTEAIIESADDIMEAELNRRDGLYNGPDVTEKRLHIACDHFIVDRKSTQSKTVIAGYPWFTDWGRDTMIALPGLTLSTKRFADAKDIIKTFIKYEKDGLIPNMFPDSNVEPMYNTIDGTLWLFIAVYQYFNETEDKDFIKEIYPTLERIIDKHIKGTTYNIHVDTDGLLSGGDPTTQLTWMDVKIDGVVVTPRHGKAVEINALWYNALLIMDQLNNTLKMNSAIDYNKYADLCKENYSKKFWNEDKQCLNDLIQDDQPVDRIRPNQIFAVSLPFSLLSEENERKVVDIVKEKLYTPLGLRSLEQAHEDYKPIYDGDVYKRDYAYHQGTVWGWLIGPYLEAHYKVYKDKTYINEALQGMFEHLNDTGIGTISEVFSGDAPHHARGCFGQAWSVSETLRAYKMIQE